MTLLGARVYDPRTRQFLSTDPLMTVPGSNGGASAYTYAWQDPVNFVDPTGLRPVSKEEYDAIRKREEQGASGRRGRRSRKTRGARSPWSASWRSASA